MGAFLSALLLAAQASAWVDPAPTGQWGASTAKLAVELLLPEMAADAVSHEVTRPILQGGPPFSVQFSGRSRSTDDGFCERSRYHVPVGDQVKRLGKGDPAVQTTEVRLGECPVAANAIFASLNSSDPLDARRAMRWIEWAQRSARSLGPLPFSITCQTAAEPERCADGGRRALASLPRDKIFIAVAQPQAPPHHWKFAVTESQTGQLYWDVAINATPGASSIDLTWGVPAPF